METKIEKVNTIWQMLVWTYRFPAMFNAKGILSMLVAVMMFSEITGQLYYSG